MVSPSKKKEKRTTNETSAVPATRCKISESQRGVSEPNVVGPSTGDEERENLLVDVKFEPNALPSLRSRNSGASLFQAVRDMNDVQHNAVREMNC
ncbi:hypothetical protein CASFOL_004570 [Castilleja foliolosa]|uniref:Uncharacterized protein n=1 Tax=Castilleja foliolosa TaxID=1961234 RepID=A0ABD3EAU4_9LAMI